MKVPPEDDGLAAARERSTKRQHNLHRDFVNVLRLSTVIAHCHLLDTQWNHNVSPDFFPAEMGNAQ